MSTRHARQLLPDLESVWTSVARDVAKLVLLACVLGCPPAWLLMRQYLDDYVYRIDMGPRLFATCAAAARAIALLTVGHAALRAALRNPVGPRPRSPRGLV